MNELRQDFDPWDRFSDFGVVVRPWQESATKDRQYLKGMIRSPVMQKREIPGLVSGIALIVVTIVILLYSAIH